MVELTRTQISPDGISSIISAQIGFLPMLCINWFKSPSGCPGQTTNLYLDLGDQNFHLPSHLGFGYVKKIFIGPVSRCFGLAKTKFDININQFGFYLILKVHHNLLGHTEQMNCTGLFDPRNVSNLLG